MKDVVVVAYDGVRLLDVAGPLEVFSAVSDTSAYRTTTVSPNGGIVVTHTVTQLLTDSSATLGERTIDTLIVPGAVDWMNLMIDGRLRQLVLALAPRSRRIVSVCAGAFVLAAAGLLDGHRAATHWKLADKLACRFPGVDVDSDAIYVRSGRTYSSAGVSAGIDLSLALVEEDLGPEVSRDVARDLVVFMQRPGGQSQFSVRLSAPATNREPLRALLDTIIADPTLDHRLEALSERCGYSGRHLTRLFHRELDTTPARYVEVVRIEAARSLLEQTNSTLDLVAARSGFGSTETLRRVFVRELGVPPEAYRRRFSTSGAIGE
ncbi:MULTISPECIES: GlxA family transcriptional regulator [Tsukamurella]|uniref:GlxA family transcriptional regulator n=1 Tax=Tsukamurella TaxID=2060 RepID=UPI001E3F33DB|nr:MULTISPECIES: helix-turn-helix domain-containing protein [Tsukamurella]